MASTFHFAVMFVRYAIMFLLPMNIVGNAIVFAVFIKKKASKHFANILLLNLATADLLFGIVLLICGLAVHIGGVPFNDIYCKTTGGVLYLSCGVSVFTLATISLERHDAVLNPARHRTRARNPNTRKVVIAIWLAAFIIVCPIVAFLEKLNISETLDDCGFAQNDTLSRVGRAYDGFVVLVLIFLPNCLICGVYGRLVYKLWFGNRLSQTPRLVVLKSRHKLTKVSFLITVVFTICWSPYYLRTLLSLALGKHPLILNVIVCRFLVVLNSCTNPVIYTLQSASFRCQMKHFLGCRNKVGLSG